MEEESHKALSADDIRHGRIVFHASVEEKSEINLSHRFPPLSYLTQFPSQEFLNCWVTYISESTCWGYCEILVPIPTKVDHQPGWWVHFFSMETKCIRSGINGKELGSLGRGLHTMEALVSFLGSYADRIHKFIISTKTRLYGLFLVI